MHSTSRCQVNKDSSSLVDWTDSSYNLHLDLYNFDSVDGNDSPYILTSPRSLEACNHLGIQPIELLHKNLMQFEEECLLTGQPLSNAKTLYELHDNQRLKKLKECRHMRERIILEQEDEDNRASPRCIKDNSYVSKSTKYNQNGKTKSKADEIGQGDNRNTGITKHLASTQSMLHQSKSSPSIDITSRTPTANSAKKLGFSSSKQFTSTPSSPAYQRPSSSDVTAPLMRSRVRGHNERSLSSCSSRQSERSRGSSASAACLLSNQDKKILDLLENKYEDEKLLEETRQEMRLAWDEQRQLEERSKVENEMQRRKNLADANWIRQRKKEKQQRQRQLKKEKEIKDAEMEMKYQGMHHDRLVKEQQTLLHHQLKQKKLNEMEKKNRQERALRKQEDDEEEYRQSVSHHVAVSQEKAEQLRQEKEIKEATEHKERRRKEKIRHSSMKATLDKYNEEHMDFLRDSIFVKHSRSQRTLENQQWLRQHEIKLNRQKEETLQEKSSKLRQNIEDDVGQWQKYLQYHSIMAQERAIQHANETIQSKSTRARQARRSRELTHKELIKRVEEDEAAFKNTIKMDLAYKDMKSRSLAAEKQDTITRSRVAARESAKLRDEIREQYQGSFDKMVQRASHLATIGRGPQMSTKNYSTFILS